MWPAPSGTSPGMAPPTEDSGAAVTQTPGPASAWSLTSRKVITVYSPVRSPLQKFAHGTANQFALFCQNLQRADSEIRKLWEFKDSDWMFGA